MPNPSGMPLSQPLTIWESLVQNAEENNSRTARTSGEMPTITGTVMPLSHNDGEVMATNEHGANTEIDNDNSGEEPTDEHRCVEPRRAWSLDSHSWIHRNNELNDKQHDNLPTDQRRFVEIDVRMLTAEQREHLVHHQESPDLQDEDSGPEPPRNKGKAIDPRNWGDIEFEPEELDNDLQEEMFEAYQKEHKLPKKYDRKTRHEKAYVKKEAIKLPTSNVMNHIPLHPSKSHSIPPTHSTNVSTISAISRHSITSSLHHSSLVALSPITRHIITPSFRCHYSSLSVSVITVLRYFGSLPPLLSSEHPVLFCLPGVPIRTDQNCSELLRTTQNYSEQLLF